MLQISKIEIPNPCHQKWHEMKPNSEGRFCTHCAKNVLNFEPISHEEILKYFTNPEEQICGRFSTKQLEDLNDYLEEKNRKILPQQPLRNNWLSRMLLLALPLVPFAFSKAGAQEVVQKSEMKDSLNTDGSFLITGVVTDEESLEPLPGVWVNNSDLKFDTVSDASGMFEIRVRIGDKIVLRGVGLYSKEMIIAENKQFAIELASETLEEVRVVAGGATVTTYRQPEDDLAPPPKGSLDLLPFFERIATWFQKR